jgi:hypothetical protein
LLPADLEEVGVVSNLICFLCLVAYETHGQQDVRYAQYVYDGKSLCRIHLNSWRGYTEDFERHPMPEEAQS